MGVRLCTQNDAVDAEVSSWRSDNDKIVLGRLRHEHEC